MKRMFLFLLLVSLSLLITSCTTNSSEPLHNQFQITLTDVWKHQHAHLIYQFEFITNELSKGKDKEKLAYLSGMIDSNLIDNPTFLPVAILTNEETKQIIADEQLQSQVLILYQNIKDYLTKLNRS